MQVRVEKSSRPARFSSHTLKVSALKASALKAPDFAATITATFAAVPQRLVLAVIRFYQNVISPRTPPTCFFYPTCSHYTYQAIERFGLWRGAWLGACRICRCHPFARGGYDPVPGKFSWFPARDVDEAVGQAGEATEEAKDASARQEKPRKDLDE